MAKSTASPTPKNILCVAGSDESEVKRAARGAAERLTHPGSGDFGCDTVDGAGDNADDAARKINRAVDALLTLPFFGGKLVWLKDANFLGDNVLGRSAAVVEALETLAATLQRGLPPGVQFLLSATEVDKRRTFYKTLTKLAEVELYDKIDASRSGWEEQAASAAAERARGLGLRFDGEALELFTMLTGGETRVIETELEKLGLYLGPAQRQIGLAEVRLLVAASRTGVIFEIGNALAQRELTRCLALVRQLLFHGESAIGILLVAIIPTVRNLLLARDLMQRHRVSRPQAPFHFTSALNRLPPEATEHLPRKKDGTVNSFQLGLAAMQAHRFEVPALRRGLAACLAANVQLVSSQLDPEVVLAEVILRVIGPTAPMATAAAR